MLEKIYKPLWQTLLILPVAIALGACSKQTPKGGPALPDAEQYTYLTLIPTVEHNAPSLRANGINTVDDNYVKEVRVIACDNVSNAVVINKLLDFGQGIGSNANGYSVPSAPEKIKPGIYNLYFIANESSVAGAAAQLSQVVDATGLKNIILGFEKQFSPEKGVKGIPMTGEKLACNIPAGMTAASPYTVKADLERVFSRLVVAIQRPAGSPAETKELYISGLRLLNVPEKYYLFPNSSSVGYAGNLLIWGKSDFPQPVPFAPKEVEKYLPEYAGADRMKLEVSIKQDATSTERIREITLAEKEGFKILRNHAYRYSLCLKDWSDLAVEIHVDDWTGSSSWIYVGEYFNLSVSKKNYAVGEEVTLTVHTSHEQAPAGHAVTLKPINGSKINGANTDVVFNERQYGAFKEYKLTPGREGHSLVVSYNGVKQVEL